MRPNLLSLLLFLFVTGVLSGCVSGSVTPSPTSLAATATAVIPSSTSTPTLTSTATATPNPTATLSPTPTERPTNTPSPTLTPSPTAKPQATLYQLTEGSCCVQPFFSPDSTKVLFIDKPSETVPAGIYGIDLSNFKSPVESPPELIYEIIGFRSPDHTIVAFPEPDDGRLMRFINEKTGESWTVNTLGNWPIFSHDGEYILWNATDRRGPYDERPTDIWISQMSVGRSS